MWYISHVIFYFLTPGITKPLKDFDYVSAHNREISSEFNMIPRISINFQFFKKKKKTWILCHVSSER